ncbi:hypothetical protein [Amorphus orientalis]|uniref:Portal protein n=1 Tax=Amorphus orientalis TaxID=649198 RepID=A0AAE4AV73_9HYPH|nr:hypothetical protein [Amorphus orientalis]MDQ0316409.1 hypothetical protein [Amorphus orientalis]
MKRERDLIKQIRQEIADFYTKRIPITVVPEEQGRREFTYEFSQRENVALIDLYYNSQFRSGKYDSEGRQKIFLNEGKFRTDVAEMQIDIDIANFLFLPSTSDLWSPWLMSRDFQQYVQDNDYGQVINSWGADLPRYGTCVGKRVGDEIMRVPIGRLINTQNAESLKKAAMSGGYAIEALQMTPQEMEAYPDWNLSGLEESDLQGAVYERYGLITPAHVKLANDETPEDGDWDEWRLGISVVNTDIHKKEKNGALVFAEFIDEDDFPYEEAHWQRQDGRWQGVGEMENQFQNQLARNVSTHLRQKSMYWAAKRMFTSTDDAVANNLAKEVADGAVIKVGPGGQITPVNTQTQHLGDFNAWDQTIENNADKTSFTYEAATGESPKAGTPFSLQVQLDRTLQKHYGKKRENFGLFLKRAFFNQQVEIFKKKTRKEHSLTFAYTDEDAELLREAFIYTQVNDRKAQNVFAGKVVSKAEIEAELREELARSPYLVVDIPDRFYDQVKYHTKLIITGEQENVGADMQTLVTFWQALQQAGDPRSEKVLEQIMALSGKNLRMIAGMKPQQQPALPQQAPARPVPTSSPVTPSIDVAA